MAKLRPPEDFWLEPRGKIHILTDIEKILADGDLNELELRVLLYIAKSAATDRYCFSKLETITIGIGKVKKDANGNTLKFKVDRNNNFKKDQNGELVEDTHGKTFPTGLGNVSRTIKSLIAKNYLRITAVKNRYSFYALGNEMVKEAPINQNTQPIEIITSDETWSCQINNPELSNQQPGVVKSTSPGVVKSTTPTDLNLPESPENPFSKNHNFCQETVHLNRNINKSTVLSTENFFTDEEFNLLWDYMMNKATSLAPNRAEEFRILTTKELVGEFVDMGGVIAENEFRNVLNQLANSHSLRSIEPTNIDGIDTIPSIKPLITWGINTGDVPSPDMFN